MKLHRSVFLFAIASIVVPCPSRGEEPLPTPTPRPKTLAEYAGKINLRRPVPSDADGGLTLSTQAIAEIAKRGTLTAGALSSGKSPETRPAISNSEKAKWQALVRKQRSVIEKLAHKRARIEKDVDLLENSRLTPRVMARLDKAGIDLDFVDEEIHRARLELARIIREARLQGAEPGWFR